MGTHRGKGSLVVIIVALLAGLFASLLWSGRISASQSEERDDLDIYLDASSAGWAQVTRQFFDAPESSAALVGSLLPQMQSADEKLALLAEVVRRDPNLDSAFIGYPDGGFIFVGRSDEASPGGFRTRTISFEGGDRQVQLAWTDADLQQIRQTADSEDAFDPRNRPWYQPVVDDQALHWTQPYVFSSSQQPGLTHSHRVEDASGELQAVVGVDIQLRQVSSFLEELAPGPNGEALLVDDLGRVIASSPMRAFPAASDDSDILPLPESQELMELIARLGSDDPDQDLVRGPSPNELRTTIVRPAGVRDEWYLAVRALDADFIEDESASNAFQILAVGVTAATAVGLFGFVVLRYLVGLKEEADVDELTAISSRRAIRRALQAALDRSKDPVYVAIVDLDDFKAINDSRGHAAGDEALRGAAARIKEFAVSAGASVGRLGGDEFLMFSAVDEPQWQQLIEGLEASPERLSASIGVAVSMPDPHDDMDQIFNVADRLLFEAKQSGRGVFCRSVHTHGV